MRSRVWSKLRAVEVFLTPDIWASGAGGLDEDGREVDPESRQARRYCVQGALVAVGQDLSPQEFRQAMQYLHEAAADASDGRHAELFALNDHPDTDFTTIRKVIATAIEAAGKDRKHASHEAPRSQEPKRRERSGEAV